MPEYRVREVRIEEFKDEVWFYPEILFNKEREVFGWYGWKGFFNWRESFYRIEKYTEWRMAFCTGEGRYRYSYATKEAALRMTSDEIGKVVVFKNLDLANIWISEYEKEFAEWEAARKKRLLNMVAVIKAGNDLEVSEKIHPKGSVDREGSVAKK